MNDRLLSLFLTSDASDWDWQQRVAVLRRTRSYSQAIEGGIELPELYVESERRPNPQLQAGDPVGRRGLIGHSSRPVHPVRAPARNGQTT